MKMNKIYVSIVAMAVLLGCSENEENPIPSDKTLKPIELDAEVTLLSRGSISTNDELTDVGIAGWEAEESETDAIYTPTPTWHTHISFSANPTEPHGVTFMQPQFYNPDPKIFTHMKAWYPCGEYTGTPNPLTSTKVTIKNTGEADVLMAPAIIGNKNNTPSGALTFKHMTSQINFLIKKGAELAEGTTIKKITIKDAQYPKGFDISKPFNTDAIIYSEAADLEVPGIQDNQTITAEAVKTGRSVMIRPITGTKFKIDVETNKATYSDCEVTLDASSMQIGYIYNITLSFGQTGLKLTAKVEEWQNATGSADIL